MLTYLICYPFQEPRNLTAEYSKLPRFRELVYNIHHKYKDDNGYFA